METPIVVIGVTILLIVIIFVMYYHTAGKPDLEAAKKEDEKRQKAFEESQKQNQSSNDQEIRDDVAPADEAKKEEVDKDKKVIDDNSIVKPGADYDIDKKSAGEKHKPDASEDACLQEQIHIPERCRIPKCDEDLPNKYFFNVHEYVSLSGRKMYCIVCSACIRGHNYRIILKNSYYPYLTSYTEKVYEKYINMFKDEHMSYEDFKTYGSENFDRVGGIIDSLFNLVY